MAHTNTDKGPSTSESLKSRKPESYKIFDDIAGTYDLLNRMLSFGIDVYWRKKLLGALPPRSEQKALDLATGTADLALTLAKDSRIQSVRGIDLSQEMITIGKQKVTKANKDNQVTLEMGDATAIKAEDESFDVVTISFGIRNFSDPDQSLRDIHRVLKEQGRLLILEFSLPKNRLVRGFYFFYFRKVLPWIGNLISRHKDAYTYLNQSVEDFPYGESFAQKMRNAGLKNVTYRPLTFGIATLYSGDKINNNSSQGGS